GCHNVAREDGRFRGMRLRRPALFAWHIRLRNWFLDDGPDRLAGDAVEGVQPALLARLTDDLARFAVDGDVHQQGSAGQILVPDPVVHDLIVPSPFPGLQIDGYDAFGEESGAGPVAAVGI